MKHCIIVKFKPSVSAADQLNMYGDIYDLFAKTKEIPGIHDIRLIPNCIARDNRYHLVIEMDMEKESLPIYDHCEYHLLWKKQYGDLLETKTIIDLDTPYQKNTFDYIPNPDRYQSLMPYIPCGKSGLKLPALSLGLWNNFGDHSDYTNMKNLLHTAFDNGMTHFDLANNYGPKYGAAEENFGKILKESFGAYRDELLISTKAGYDMWPGPYGDHGSRKYLLSSLDQSLKRMGLDYVDIFYHHRPDPDTPLEETMGALAHAVHSGKALYVGLSRYDGPQMKKATAILEELHCPFVINQVRYSLFDRSIETNGLKEAAVEKGKGIIVFSPLEQGLLSDKYLHGIPADSRISQKGGTLMQSVLTPKRIKQLHELNLIAAERGQTLAQMALSWVRKDSAITSIVMGASKPEQILENCKIVDAPAFTCEELDKIEAIWKAYPIASYQPSPKNK